MPNRIKLDHVARRGSGSVPATLTDASLLVYARNDDGSNGAQTPLWNASTGGASTLSAVNPVAAGNYDYYVPEPGRYNLVETIDGVVLPAVAKEYVSSKLEAVIAPTFAGTWVNYGAPYHNAGYYKTSEGLVVLRGMIKSGTINTAAFTLPAGYRPSANLIFPVFSNNAHARLDVSSGGVVTPVSGSNLWVSLENVEFRAEA